MENNGKPIPVSTYRKLELELELKANLRYTPPEKEEEKN